MKNQLRNLLKWIILGGIICVFLMIPEISIAKLIAQNGTKDFTFYSTIMAIFTSSVYVIIVILKMVQYQRALKKYKRKILEESKEKLSSEFKTVFLNNSSNISKEIFKCQAKVDDDGKIICKICVDYETKLNSYEEFLRYFHFDR